MFKGSKTPLDSAKFYISKGFRPIPLPYKGKAPDFNGWQQFDCTEDEAEKYFNDRPSDFNDKKGNVALILDKGLVDVDLDSKEAVELAEYYLPAGGCKYGRETSRESHWMFYAKGSITTKQFAGPTGTTQDTENTHGDMILELRTGEGKSARVPPSFHSNGEQLFYEDGFENLPYEVDSEFLLVRCGQLASAVLIYREYKEGKRQEICNSFAGATALEGWDRNKIIGFLEYIWDVSGDTEKSSRRAGIEETVDKVEAGDSKVTGFKRLSELLGDATVDKIREWLKIGSLSTHIVELNGKYHVKRFAKGMVSHNEQITTFTIEPLNCVFVHNEGERLKCNLIIDNRQFPAELTSDCWHSVRDFRKEIAKFVVGQSVTAKENDLQDLRHYLFQQKGYKSSTGLKVCGFHKNVFVTDQGSLTSEGEDSSIVYLPIEGAKISCSLIDVDLEEMTQENLKDFQEHLHKFNEEYITLSVLGWTTACFYKDIIHDVLGKFPILVLEGGAGVGKSSTFNHIIKRLWSVDYRSLMLDASKTFSSYVMCSSSNAIPLLYEENKITAEGFKKHLKENVHNLIKSTYEAYPIQRGTANQKINNYEMIAPLAIAGEVGFSNSAVNDRIIQLPLGKMRTEEHRENFIKLCELPLEFIGKKLLTQRLNSDSKQLKKEIFSCQSEVTDLLAERPRDNSAICRFGLKKLSEALGVEYNLSAIDDAVCKTVFGSKLEAVELEDGSVKYEERDSLIKITEVDKIVEAFSWMSHYFIKDLMPSYLHHGVHLEADNHYHVKNGEIRLRIPMIYSIFKKWAQMHHYEGDLLDKVTFEKQIATEPYFIHNGTMRFGQDNRPVRGIRLDLGKILEKGLKISDVWTDPPESERDTDQETNITYMEKYKGKENVNY